MNEALRKTITENVRAALIEDIGSGDVTAALVAADTLAHAKLTLRENAVICGCSWFDEVFRQLDPGIRVTWHAGDGDHCDAGMLVAELKGNARAILTGERSAMNFLQTLSGTATITAAYAAELSDTSCKVLDTRKTVPGLRIAQKHAVRCGGGHNHRIGLYDAILIKENHIMSCGSVDEAVRIARSTAAGLLIEIEVENLVEFRAALAAGAERIMLDDFSLQSMRDAVGINRESPNPAELEASGSMTIERLKSVAATGVDYISVGGLTKHVLATDFSMRFELN